MKHIYILLTVTLFTTTLFGQTSSEKTKKAVETIQRIIQTGKAEIERGDKSSIGYNKKKLYGITRENRYKNTLKSASGNDLKLDSVITENWIDSTSLWIPGNKYEKLYDGNGNSTRETDFNWNNDSDKWVELIYMEWNYDASGNIIDISGYINFGAPFGLLLVLKEEFSFNLHGKITELIQTSLNWETLQTTVDSKTEYNYDDLFENVSFEMISKWDNDSSMWIVDQKIEYSYNENEVEKTTFNWVDSAGQWANYEKYDYLNDSIGNVLQRVKYVVNDSNQWILKYKWEYNYDTFGNKTKYVQLNWDDSSNEWIGSRKEEYFYNENGLGTLDLIYKWDGTIADWIFYSKNDDAVYDENGYLSEYLIYMWDQNINDWMKWQKKTNYYSPLIATGISEIASQIYVKVYPNPAGDFVVFDVENSTQQVTIELYNLNGEKVFSEKSPLNKQISIRQLNRGIYLYKVILGNETFSGKIIKN